VDDGSLFDRFAPLYDLVMPPASTAELEAALDLADRPVDRILDVGGGSGRAARVVPGAVVVDASRGMLERARTRGLATVQADAASLPVARSAVDAVLIVDALHHFPDPPAALAEVARVLAPGGVLVVREFDPTTLRGRGVNLAERAMGWDAQFYTPDALADRVHETGLAAHVLDRSFGYTVAGVREPDEP